MLVGDGGGAVLVLAGGVVGFVFGYSPVVVELETVSPLGTFVIVFAGASLVAESEPVGVRGVAVAVVGGEAGLPCSLLFSSFGSFAAWA